MGSNIAAHRECLSCGIPLFNNSEFHYQSNALNLAASSAGVYVHILYHGNSHVQKIHPITLKTYKEYLRANCTGASPSEQKV